jgi:methylated-DNA-protein-cysteine methyltransferase-like protein
MSLDPRHELILEVIEGIPEGRVATYGQIAEAAGLPRNARLVGRIMRNLPQGSAIPWFRVVGAGGRISVPHPDGAHLQRQLLEDEGVGFVGHRVDMKRFGHFG